MATATNGIFIALAILCNICKSDLLNTSLNVSFVHRRYPFSFEETLVSVKCCKVKFAETLTADLVLSLSQVGCNLLNNNSPVLSLNGHSDSMERPRIRVNAFNFCVLCLLRCGDIQPHPGPRTFKNTCTVCSKGVIATSKAITCVNCESRTHVRCSRLMTVPEFDQFVQNNIPVNHLCDICTLNELPTCSDSDDDPVEVSSSDFTVGSNDHAQGPPDPCVNDKQPHGHAGKRPPIDEHYQCFQRKGLHILHLNARSLYQKWRTSNYSPESPMQPL